MSRLKVGIDFGTSNSGVAVYDGSRVSILPIDQQNVVPEVVKTILYVTKDHKYYIGQDAVELYYRHNVDRQRRFEKKWAGEIEFHGAEMFYVRDVYVYVDVLKPGRLLQFIKSALRSNNYQGTVIFDEFYSLQHIIRIYLQALKTRTETILNEEISAVTLGRPVKFSESVEEDQQSSEILRSAAYEAGFQQVDFELEPIAAAIYYEKMLETPQNVLIFDFGGGTLDITIMRLGDPKSRRVYASNGIGIAGADFDRRIIQKRMLPHFGEGKTKKDPEIESLLEAVSDWQVLPELSTPHVKSKIETEIHNGNAPVQMQALESLIFNDLAFSFYNKVESAKIQLSSQGATCIELQEKGMDIWELYTRYQFEADISNFVSQIEAVLLETVIASGLEPEEIDAVVKTGGSSNIPIFTAILKTIFGAERVKASNTFSSVVGGLAIKAFET
jgi:hypothetical chaperone protein